MGRLGVHPLTPSLLWCQGVPWATATHVATGKASWALLRDSVSCSHLITCGCRTSTTHTLERWHSGFSPVLQCQMPDVADYFLKPWKVAIQSDWNPYPPPKPNALSCGQYVTLPCVTQPNTQIFSCWPRERSFWENTPFLGALGASFSYRQQLFT